MKFPRNIPVISFDDILFPGSKLTIPIAGVNTLRLIAESLKNNGYVGILQPLPCIKDKFFESGTLGKIIETQEFNQFEACVLIEGMSRFKLQKFTRTESGYLKATVSYTPYLTKVNEKKENCSIDKKYLIQVTQNYLKQLNIEFDPTALEEYSSAQLIRTLVEFYPFNTIEKQYLLGTKSENEQMKIIRKIFELNHSNQNHMRLQFH